MNWHKIAAEAIYIWLLVVYYLLTQLVVLYIPNNIVAIPAAGIGIVIFMIISMGVVHDSLPESISKYWKDNP